MDPTRRIIPHVYGARALWWAGATFRDEHKPVLLSTVAVENEQLGGYEKKSGFNQPPLRLGTDPGDVFYGSILPPAVAFVDGGTFEHDDGWISRQTPPRSK